MRAPKRLGPYDVLDLIGRGAMGAVYRARHRELGAERAVKIMLGASTVRAERFLRESRNLARVRHPNVVRVHESGSEAGVLFYAMDLIEGRPLSDALAEGRLDLDRALGVAIGVCNGVAALHTEGIVHRDLKPENILLDTEGSPVVLDLGLAVAPELDQRLTKTGAFVGTPWYMAPEQARGERASVRSDVFALGLIAHELTSGYAISESGAVPGFVDVPSPSSVDGSLPRSLDQVCARALDTDPEQRFADASELAAALHAIRQDPGPSRRAVRFLQAGAALVGSAALGLTLWALGDSPPNPAARSERSAPAPATSDTPYYTPEQRAATERELRRIRRLAPEPRHAELVEWIDRHPSHPALPRAQDLLRDARLRFPLRSERRPDFADLGFLDNERFALARIQEDRSGSLDLRTVSGRRERQLFVPSERITALAASPDGRSICFSLVPYSDASPEAKARSRAGTWILDTLNEAAEPERLSGRVMTRLVFSADGKRIAGGGPYEEVRLFGFDPLLKIEFGPYHGNINDLALSPDGRYLVVTSGGSFTHRQARAERLDLWDAQTQKAVYRAESFSRITCLAFSPRGDHYVVGSADGRIRRFGLINGEPGEQFVGPGSMNSLQGKQTAHPAALRELAFSRDGAFLHSGGPTRGEGAGLRRLWDARTRKLLGSFAHSAPVRTISPTPDGEHLAVVTHDAVELWAAGPPPLLDDPTANGAQPREGQ